eukprot:Amastigsp_a6982_116.p2 type:complete len:242 gc:universal Amastigsp_a6982_116:1081-356(-)
MRRGLGRRRDDGSRVVADDIREPVAGRRGGEEHVTPARTCLCKQVSEQRAHVVLVNNALAEALCLGARVLVLVPLDRGDSRAEHRRLVPRKSAHGKENNKEENAGDGSGHNPRHRHASRDLAPMLIEVVVLGHHVDDAVDQEPKAQPHTGDDVKEKLEKVLVVEVPHAVVDPWAVVIFTEHAAVTVSAVMAPRRLGLLARSAKARRRLCEIRRRGRSLVGPLGVGFLSPPSFFCCTKCGST